MKAKLFLTFSTIILIKLYAVAQIQHSSADMSGFLNNRLLGSMIIYYGSKTSSGTNITSWYVYEVHGKEVTDRAALGSTLTDKAGSGSIGYEWRAGSSCNAALGYVTQKTGLRIGGTCAGEYNTNNSNAGNTTSAGSNGMTGYQSNTYTEAGNVIMQLDTYGWALVNDPIKDAEQKLIDQGWTRVSAQYKKLSPGYSINYWVNYKPGTSYTILAAVSRGSDSANIRMLDHSDSNNRMWMISDKYPSGTKMIIPDFHQTENMDTLLFRNTVYTGPQISGSLVIYKRDVNYRRDFDAIAADAHNAFKNITAYPVIDKDDGEIMGYGEIGLGTNKRLIFKGNNGKKTYRLIFKKDSPDAIEAKEAVMEIINERIKNGKYTLKEEDNKSEHSTIIYNETRENFLTITVNSETNKLKFFFFE